MRNFRIEADSMGQLEVPAHALYAAQTQRAIINFPVSGTPMPKAFIKALILVKYAAAKANGKLALLPEKMADAICQAADDLLASNFHQHFPVDVFQTGSGTSSNMNANEVLATLANKVYPTKVDANDHVNFGQSSNDTIPTSIHVSAAIELNEKLLPALTHLRDVTRRKAIQVDKYVKTGRTHLMDAMPVRMSQSLNAWAEQINLNISRLTAIQPQLQTLAQGGTAVGTGINADPNFAEFFAKALSQKSGIEFAPAQNFFTHIGSQDIAVALSGQLKATAVSIMKIANDLRWMNSGPLAGLGEIELEALQPGSSIMPGKVNPVIPESACMAAAQVIGNDTTITIAGQSGNFELNVMLPVIAKNLLESIELLANISQLLGDKAIKTFVVKDDKLTEVLARNPILVTALNPIIGYAKAAEIAKLAYKQGRPIIEVAQENTNLSIEELERLLDPTALTQGGVQN
ncbi:fumarate hydratase [Catenovulum agarivorans DS-2]|uniref:Fumarate hydratase class II n=1 Tax=Catenovulum agarivorans DS-2 TaxID=1328313 RepID=W7R0E5_9ALTE|nr:class II fumarate hydratase [Catenovulum agarivorans]EWH11075.1 fumarate hydratase [Catenovulum agarivorans DS-2]